MSFCNVCTDVCAIDLFTWTHLISGVIFYILKIGIIEMNLLHAAYELFNHTFTHQQFSDACKTINSFIRIFPHCKLNPVSWSNSVVDQAFANIGWLLAAKVKLKQVELPLLLKYGIILVMPWILILIFEQYRIKVLGIKPDECEKILS